MSKKVEREERPKPLSQPLEGMSMAKQRLIRVLAALVVPGVILGVLELLLRLVGYGYPTHFFVPSRTGSPGVFEENPRFGWRFFPRELARAPDPIRLSKTKPPGTCRIFVFGESAALGDPEPAYGFSRMLKEVLEERCSGTKFEVVNVAITAISSHVILRIARDCVPFQGDIWILYMGNNEVVGPFGAGSVFGPKSPPLSLIKAGLAVRSMRLGQLFDALWQRAPLSAQPAQQWEGMKMMLNEQVRASDPILQRVYSHFGSNLREILEAAKRSGATPIVCSVSSNLKDCPPFASLHRADLPEARRLEWERLLASGGELESTKAYVQALANYRRATEIDDAYAALPFRMARCFLVLGDSASAREYYLQARDLDALRFRADSALNRITRQLSSSRAEGGVTFFDSEAVLTNACKLGIPGAECFWDHVHLNFAGNYLVARGLAEKVISLLPEQVRRAAEANRRVLTETECAQRLAYTDWDQLQVLEQMWQRVHEPPFTAQLDHQQLVERWSALRTELERKLNPEALAQAIGVYRAALPRRDDDWVLHHRLGYLLEAAGDFSGAEQQWKRVIEMLPRYADAWFKLGDLSARESKFGKAEDYLTQVLRVRPDSCEALNDLGLIRMSQSQPGAAARFFELALRHNPKFAQAHVNWGVLLSRQGRPAEAEAHYRQALRAAPDGPGAHINLANLLATQQRFPEAIEHYLEAARLQPREATIRLGLANALQATGRANEALQQYQEAVRLNPSLAEAHFNWGVALAKRGDLAGATTRFQEAVRLNPADAQAHLDLGVALAKQNRLREAILEFQGVLRLDPANGPARQYLETAIAREGLKQ